MTPMGPRPWDNIRSWDRFFFLLLIREYTFVKGEKAIQFDEDCKNCDNPVTFTLSSTALEFEMPDPDIGIQLFASIQIIVQASEIGNHFCRRG